VRPPSPSRRKTFSPESTLTAARCFSAPSPWSFGQVQGTGPPTDRFNCRRSTPGLNPTGYRDYYFHSVGSRRSGVDMQPQLQCSKFKEIQLSPERATRVARR
jgi:hypothetical protein